MQGRSLALFFSYGISLKTWVDMGLIEREKLIYEELLKKGVLEKIIWFTYGTGDKELEGELKRKGKLHPDIKVVPMPRIFKKVALLYSILMPFLHLLKLRNVKVLKTNQMPGAWTALIARFLFRKPLILRTGYTWSRFLHKRKNLIFRVIVSLLERLAYTLCDIGVVSSNGDKKYICERYSVNPKKIYVIYNYVDTDLFRPLNDITRKESIIFVGRLSEEKNLFNLIKAVSKLGITLDIYGGGKLEEKLKCYLSRVKADINLRGVVPNSELPRILNKYTYFVIPSYYECMPKSLLEAMACGLVCIATGVGGGSEIIEDGVDGFLIYDLSEKGILKVLEKAIKCSYKDEISNNAVRKIEKFFSLRSAVEKESAIISKVLN